MALYCNTRCISSARKLYNTKCNMINNERELQDTFIMHKNEEEDVVSQISSFNTKQH